MELTKTNLDCSRTLLDSQNTYEESADAIVPDTFPDILRISAAYGTVQLKDDSPQTGRVLISGSIAVTVLYVPEGGGLRRLTVPISFAHIEEGAGITETSPLFVSCQIVSTNASVMNSRKISVSAILSVQCSVFSQEQLQLTSGVASADDNLALLSSTHQITIPTAVQRREFTIMDDLPLTELNRFQEVFAPHGDLRVTECRILNGKAVLKGDCLLHLLGITPEGELDHLDCSMPFTQIFDAPNFEETNQMSVRFSLRHLDAEKSDDSQLSIGIGINVLLTAFATQSLESIADVYHLQYPVHIDTNTLDIPACCPLSECSCEASETVPVGMKVVSVTDVRAALDTVLQEDNRFSLRMMASILYRSDDSEYYTISRAVHIPLSLPENTGSVQITGIVCRVSATVSGENSVVLSLSGRCSLLCANPLRITDVQQLTVDTSAALERVSPVSVILRYVEQDERLWDIAKHYRTTVDAIQQANQIAADCPSVSAQMLLIPIR
jgi:hypothetical protein